MNRRRGNAARVAWNCLDILLVLLTRKTPEVLATDLLNPHTDFRIPSSSRGQHFYGHPREINENGHEKKIEASPSSARAIPITITKNRAIPKSTRARNILGSQYFQTAPSRGSFGPKYRENADASRQEQDETALGQYFEYAEDSDDDVWQKNSSLSDERFLRGANFEKYAPIEKDVHFDEAAARRPRWYHDSQSMGRQNYYPVQRDPTGHQRFVLNNEIARLSPEDQQKCISQLLEFEQLHDICNIASQIIHIVNLLKRRSYLVRWLLRKKVKKANIGRPSLGILLNKTIRQLTRANEKMRRILEKKGTPSGGYKQPKWIADRPTQQRYPVVPAVITPQTVPPTKPVSTTTATTTTQTTPQTSTNPPTVPSIEESSKIAETTVPEVESTTESSTAT